MRLVDTTQKCSNAKVILSLSLPLSHFLFVYFVYFGIRKYTTTKGITWYPFISVYRLQEDSSVLVMGSDGLFDKLMDASAGSFACGYYNEAIADTDQPSSTSTSTTATNTTTAPMTGLGRADKAARLLVQRAFDSKSMDNISCLAIFFK